MSFWNTYKLVKLALSFKKEKKGVMRNMIEMLVAVVVAGALLPTAVNNILNANLTGIYKTLWTVTAIIVVAGGMYVVLKKAGIGTGR